MQSKLAIFLGAAAAVLPLDQWTKQLVVRRLSLGDQWPVIDGFFSITHSVNQGLIFGWFWGSHVAAFTVLTAAAVALIASFYRHVHETDRASAAALGLILGGALGNWIDRVARVGVVDFLHFDFGSFVYPDFNCADSAIVIGVALLLLQGHLWEPRGEAAAE